MHIDLTGKTAIVTGSTAGIGFATARGLAEAGAAVVVNGRTQASVDPAVAALAAHGQVRGVAADLATPDGCARLTAAVPDCDILINNMGIFEQKDFFDVPDADWERFFTTNVMSGVRLSRAYLPGMAARGWGRVVFISSESALNIPAAMIHYGFTKTAQLAVSRGLAKRMAGTGVTVNAVLPGPTMSDGRRGRQRLRENPPVQLHHPAHGECRGSGQHGRLRRLAAGVGHHRRRATRRWRRGGHDCLTAAVQRIAFEAKDP
jgi:NAD(P)-dependent dehydrogenase (short-subunit alcohol dehydrogenase family)